MRALSYVWKFASWTFWTGKHLHITGSDSQCDHIIVDPGNTHHESRVVYGKGRVTIPAVIRVIIVEIFHFYILRG